ncbi:MAG TPA: CU044_5270 family protein [Streptosporangiaceae bacterium]|nr:CU044_5270 family protein [Streptosporangiaceae bacterium]
MPGIDEDIMRELMHRCTDDLHASPHVAAAIVRRQRHRRLRNRALGAAATGVAAGTAFAVVASAPGARPSQAPGPVTASGIRLTAAQKSLYQLSDAAARTSRPGGRYVILAEKQDDYERTSVVDSLTGDVWTYQHGAGVPSELPVARHDSPTAAQFDAMPTDTASLRALLIKQGKEQQAQAITAEKKRLKGVRKKADIRQPHLTDDDWAFDQATTLLWNPLVGPQLRAALYKVLADTPGVRVDNHARDGLGRAAVEISRTATSTGIEDQTFENPKTGAVLETAFVYQDGTTGTDLYMPVTSSNHVPPNPYQS